MRKRTLGTGRKEALLKRKSGMDLRRVLLEKMKKDLRNLDLRETLSRTRSGWMVSWQYGQAMPRQTTSPRDKNLLRKVGIKKKESVLVFAGCYGDWAEALGKAGAAVVYTDASKSMIQYVKKTKKGIPLVRQGSRDAVLLPQLNKKYDWSFSFEPLPLIDKMQDIFPVIRGLLNRKGIKIVHSVSSGYTKKTGGERIAQIAGLYGAKHGFVSKNIVCTSEGKEIEHFILTIQTNPKARRKAEIDLAVIRESNRQKKLDLNKILDSKNLKRLKVSEKEFNKCIRRLQELVELLRSLKPKTSTRLG